jgi:GTP diphosphokinase / guanosine-3',5'-bis(diphosphate) 3'-diphosphatase
VAAAAEFEHRVVDDATSGAAAGPKTKLSDDQRVLLGGLFAVIQEHSADAAEQVDRALVQRAFVFSCERHADQRRASGEDFIVHPVGVAKICAGMRLDTGTLCAALLHDTVEDTSASLEEVRDEFGEEIASLVDGVTKHRHHLPEPRRPAGGDAYRATPAVPTPTRLMHSLSA